MEPTETSQEVTTDDEPRPEKSRTSPYLFFNRLNRYLGLTTSILVKGIILVLLFTSGLYLYKELTDSSYHISEIRLPQHLVDQGYHGSTLATDLERQIINFIHGSHFTWSKNEVEQYNRSDSKAQIQVEVAGLGFTPQSITKAIREMVGLPRKEIVGDIITSDSVLVLRIVIDKHILSPITVPIDNDLNTALDDLISKGALEVLEATEPLVAGVLYAGDYSIGKSKPDPEQAVKMFRNTIGSKPDQASLAYAWWARVVWLENRDSVEAMERIDKALKLDPNNALAYRTLSTIKYQTGKLKEAEALIKKSLELDPTSASGWATLANRYRLLNGARDSDAIDSYRKAIKLDPDNMYEFELAYLLARNKDYKRALEVIEDKENSGVVRSDMEGLKYACMIGNGDSVRAAVLLKKTRSRGEVADAVNRLAYQFEQVGSLEEALYFALLAIKTDSTADAPYTTLAEVHGLKSNDDEFYQNLEHAFKLGYDVKAIAEAEEEPYKTYSSQERFKQLLRKYSK